MLDQMMARWGWFVDFYLYVQVIGVIAATATFGVIIWLFIRTFRRMESWKK